MKTSHISRIKGNISIYSKNKASNILDGSYRAIYKGKSQNFDELREYNIGDNVRDIDWKASARSNSVLVKQYIAEKKHNVLFILDSKRAMNAHARDNVTYKSDLLLNVSGTLAYLAYRNGDYTGCIYTLNGQTEFFPFKQNMYNIEYYLTSYEENLKKAQESDMEEQDINKSLKYVLDNINKNMIIFILTDLVGLDEMDENLIKTLSFRHDIMVVNIEDANLYENNSYDFDKSKYFSSIFLKNKKLLEIENNEKKKVYEQNDKEYMKYRITLTSIGNNDEIIPKIIELLERHRYAINS